MFSSTFFQEKGIAASDLKKLEDGGVYTIEGLAHGSKKELALIKGLSDAKIEKMQKEGTRGFIQSKKNMLILC